MRRRPPQPGTPLNQKQEELAQRESQLRGEMEKLERMIAEAPRVAEETTRRQREELLARASEGRSRLEASGGESSEMDLPEVTAGTAGLGGKSFVQWLQIGFAVTLPLIVFGILALLIFFWIAQKGQ